VIASLKGADYAILVTEPTPSALHDLKRVIEVVGHFKVPIGIVLNRSDMHEVTRTRLLKLVKEYGFELLVEIPYDPLLPSALAEGRLAIQAYPDAPSSMAIRMLSDKIDNRISSMEPVLNENFAILR
jgi:MinD superfamily P-loop ATPase